jgi:hypothetical protein
VIIGVNLGDGFRIKTRPKNVLAAYEFVQSLSADLANFWPQYLTGTPTDEERDLLASVVVAGAIQTRPIMVAGPDLHAVAKVLTLEPERQLVLDGAGASGRPRPPCLKTRAAKPVQLFEPRAHPTSHRGARRYRKEQAHACSPVDPQVGQALHRGHAHRPQ